MPLLRTANKSTDIIAPEEILETLLVEAGTAGEIPTDEKRLLKFLELEQMSFDFMNELPFLDTDERPPVNSGPLFISVSELLQRKPAWAPGEPDSAYSMRLRTACSPNTMQNYSWTLIRH